jgi:hypothetical protein
MNRTRFAIAIALAAACQLPAFEVYTAWPFDSTEAVRRQQETAASIGMPAVLTVNLPGNVAFDLVLIPAGRALIGSPPSVPGYEGDEALHWFTFNKPYYIARHELTGGQYKALFPDNVAPAPEFPARLGYLFARDTVLPRLQQYVPAGLTLTLPAKDPWENACRAGTGTIWYSGDSASDLGRIGWYQGNSGGQIHATGLKLPNAWGLYDMVGNVWTWVITLGAETASSFLVKGGAYDQEAFGNGCRTGNLMMQSTPSGVRIMATITIPSGVGDARSGEPLRIAQPVHIAGAQTLFGLNGRIVASPAGVRAAGVLVQLPAGRGLTVR